MVSIWRAQHHFFQKHCSYCSRQHIDAIYLGQFLLYLTCLIWQIEQSFQGPVVLELGYGWVILWVLPTFFPKEKKDLVSSQFYWKYLSPVKKGYSGSEEMPKNSLLFPLNLGKFRFFFMEAFEIDCNPDRLGKDKITSTEAEVYEEIIYFCQPSEITASKVEDLRIFNFIVMPLIPAGMLGL